MNHRHYYYAQVLKQFEPLLHRTLHRLQMRPMDPSYEDYLQELRIHLVTLTDQFGRNPLASDDDRYCFCAYASRGLYWHLIDCVRTQSRHDAVVPVTGETLDVFEGGAHQSSLYLMQFLQMAHERLSPEDAYFLQCVLSGEWTMREIAQQLGISRKTLYQRRRRIQAQLADIKELLYEGNTH